MQWTEEGLVLVTRKHGETSVVLEILTRDRGRAVGLARGGRSKTLRATLQPGNTVVATWRARLEEHLGIFTVEPVRSRAALLIDHPTRLAALTTVTALTRLLAEREPHPRLFDATVLLLDQLEDDALWPALMVRWELGLLDELGFGLDLASCAATGRNEALSYVSPKSGRAVSREAGDPYRDRLLRLPAFLMTGGQAEPSDIRDGFALTAYFLQRHLLEPRGLTMPSSRSLVVDSLGRA
jgi:DNA repair protein RecO (recombination protein O)